MSKYPPTALFVESPWYGVLEICGVPGTEYIWGVECWDGDHIAGYVTETLRPLTPAAARMLNVPTGATIWDATRVRRWENEGIHPVWW